MKLKREISAGGVVYRKLKIKKLASRDSFGMEKLKIVWLLVRPRGGDGFHDQIRWQLPKGWQEKNETIEETALREVKEEGGVKAQIVDKIDTIQFFFRNVYEGKPKELVCKRVTFFLMEFQEETKEGFDQVEVKEVVWLPYQEAYRRLTFDSEKKILEKAKKMLEKQTRKGRSAGVVKRPRLESVGS